MVFASLPSLILAKGLSAPQHSVYFKLVVLVFWLLTLFFKSLLNSSVFDMLSIERDVRMLSFLLASVIEEVDSGSRSLT